MPPKFSFDTSNVNIFDSYENHLFLDQKLYKNTSFGYFDYVRNLEFMFGEAYTNYAVQTNRLFFYLEVLTLQPQTAVADVRKSDAKKIAIALTEHLKSQFPGMVDLIYAELSGESMSEVETPRFRFVITFNTYLGDAEFFLKRLSNFNNVRIRHRYAVAVKHLDSVRAIEACWNRIFSFYREQDKAVAYTFFYSATLPVWFRIRDARFGMFQCSQLFTRAPFAFSGQGNLQDQFDTAAERLYTFFLFNLLHNVPFKESHSRYLFDDVVYSFKTYFPDCLDVRFGRPLSYLVTDSHSLPLIYDSFGRFVNLNNGLSARCSSFSEYCENELIGETYFELQSCINSVVLHLISTYFLLNNLHVFGTSVCRFKNYELYGGHHLSTNTYWGDRYEMFSAFYGNNYSPPGGISELVVLSKNENLTEEDETNTLYRDVVCLSKEINTFIVNELENIKIFLERHLPELTESQPLLPGYYEIMTYDGPRSKTSQVFSCCNISLVSNLLLRGASLNYSNLPRSNVYLAQESLSFSPVRICDDLCLLPQHY